METTSRRSRRDWDHDPNQRRSRSIEDQIKRMEGQVSSLRKEFARSAVVPVATVNRYRTRDFDDQRQSRPSFSPGSYIRVESADDSSPQPRTRFPERDLVESQYHRERDEVVSDSECASVEIESSKKVFNSPRGSPNPYHAVQTEKRVRESVSPRPDASPDKVRFSPTKCIRFAEPVSYEYERSASPEVWDISSPENCQMWVNKRHEYDYEDIYPAQARHLRYMPGVGYGYYDYPSPRKTPSEKSSQYSASSSGFFEALNTSIYSPRPTRWERTDHGGPIYRRDWYRRPVYTDPYEELNNYDYYLELQGKPEQDIKEKLKREISNPVYVDPPESRRHPFYKRLWDERNKYTSAKRVPPEESLLPPEKPATKGTRDRSYSRDRDRRSSRDRSLQRSPSVFVYRQYYSPTGSPTRSPARRKFKVIAPTSPRSPRRVKIVQPSPEDKEVERYLKETKEESEVISDYSPLKSSERYSSGPPSYPPPYPGEDLVESRYKRETTEIDSDRSYTKSEKKSSYEVYSPRSPRCRSLSPPSRPRYVSPSRRPSLPDYLVPRHRSVSPPRHRSVSPPRSFRMSYSSPPRYSVMERAGIFRNPSPSLPTPVTEERTVTRTTHFAADPRIDRSPSSPTRRDLQRSPPPIRKVYSDVGPSYKSPRSTELYSSLKTKDKISERQANDETVYSEQRKRKEKQYIESPRKVAVALCKTCAAQEDSPTSSESSDVSESPDARCTQCRKSLDDSGYCSIRIEHKESSDTDVSLTNADKLISEYNRSKQKWQKYGGNQAMSAMPVEEVRKTKYKRRTTSKERDGVKEERESTKYKSVHVTTPRDDYRKSRWDQEGRDRARADPTRVVPPLDLASVTDESSVSVSQEGSFQESSASMSYPCSYTSSPSRSYKYLMGDGIKLAPWQRDYMRKGIRPPKEYSDRTPSKDYPERRPSKEYSDRRPPQDYPDRRPPKEYSDRRPPQDYPERRPQKDSPDKNYVKESRKSRETYRVSDGDYTMKRTEKSKRSKEISSVSTLEPPTPVMSSAPSSTTPHDVYSSNLPVLSKEQLAKLAAKANPKEKFEVRKIPQRKETPYVVINMGGKGKDSYLIVPKKQCKSVGMRKKDVKNLHEGAIPKHVRKRLPDPDKDPFPWSESDKYPESLSTTTRKSYESYRREETPVLSRESRASHRSSSRSRPSHHSTRHSSHHSNIFSRPRSRPSSHHSSSRHPSHHSSSRSRPTSHHSSSRHPSHHSSSHSRPRSHHSSSEKPAKEREVFKDREVSWSDSMNGRSLPKRYERSPSVSRRGSSRQPIVEQTEEKTHERSRHYYGPKHSPCRLERKRTTTSKTVTHSPRP